MEGGGGGAVAEVILVVIVAAATMAAVVEISVAAFVVELVKHVIGFLSSEVLVLLPFLLHNNVFRLFGSRIKFYKFLF